MIKGPGVTIVTSDILALPAIGVALALQVLPRSLEVCFSAGRSKSGALEIVVTTIAPDNSVSATIVELSAADMSELGLALCQLAL